MGWKGKVIDKVDEKIKTLPRKALSEILQECTSSQEIVTELAAICF